VETKASKEEAMGTLTYFELASLAKGNSQLLSFLSMSVVSGTPGGKIESGRNERE
jgi:hypothetical protein